MEQPEGQPVEPEYLTLDAVSAKASIPRQTLYNYISEGRIGKAEGVRRIGRARRIHWPSFKRWIEAQS